VCKIVTTKIHTGKYNRMEHMYKQICTDICFPCFLCAAALASVYMAYLPSLDSIAYLVSLALDYATIAVKQQGIIARVYKI
jgi:hypothetical protein